MSLLHGKMTSAEKTKRLSEFSEAEQGKGLRVLVSTSIIEVSEVRGRSTAAVSLHRVPGCGVERG